MDIGQPTLDQLRIFLAVHDEGSFSAAARRLNRAVSVISYAIATLEAQLAVSLFYREGSRLPQLTDAGRALLPTARKVMDEADELIARARSIQAGVESEVSIVLDVMVPFDTVSSILRDFREAFPLVDLRLHVEALGAVAALVLDRRADLAVAGPIVFDLAELEREEVGCVELVPVAAPDHPLSSMGPVRAGDTRNHLQLVLTDRSSFTDGREFSVLSPRSWRLADLGAKRALLLGGNGWGYMPHHLVADDIAQGRLRILDLAEGSRVDYRLNALWRKDRLPGPATRWMIDALGTAL